MYVGMPRFYFFYRTVKKKIRMQKYKVAVFIEKLVDGLDHTSGCWV